MINLCDFIEEPLADNKTAVETKSYKLNNLIQKNSFSNSTSQELASTHNFKNSNNICSDSISDNLKKNFDQSYVNNDIPDVDDLIYACASINLNESRPELLDNGINNLSQNQTFTSATDDTFANETELRFEESIQIFETCSNLETNQFLYKESPKTKFKISESSVQSSIIPYVSFEKSVLQRYNEFKKLNNIQLWKIEETNSIPTDNSDVKFDTKVSVNDITVEYVNEIGFSFENINDELKKGRTVKENFFIESNLEKLNLNFYDEKCNEFVKKKNEFIKDCETIVSDLNKTNIISENLNSFNKTQNIKDENALSNVQKNSSFNRQAELIDNTNIIIQSTNFMHNEKKLDNTDTLIKRDVEKKDNDNCILEKINTSRYEPSLFIPKDINVLNPNQPFFFDEPCKTNILNTTIPSSTPIYTKKIKEDMKEGSNKNSVIVLETSERLRCVNEQKILNFDDTVIVNKSIKKSLNSELISNIDDDVSNNLLSEKSLNIAQENEYEAFQPQQQSTNLSSNVYNCQVLEVAQFVAKDIDYSLENSEESEHFISATTELFEDPSALDFLNHIGSQTIKRDERYDSLYMKFDPLAERHSMLSQKNLPTSSQKTEEKTETQIVTSLSNTGTPKTSSTLAAIDRLLFCSPCNVSTSDMALQETKKEINEEQDSKLIPIIDEKITKELELVRATVIQLETELEKQKQEQTEQLQKQKEFFEDKINHIKTKFNQVQTQLTQEIKCKDQMTVVVEEYEKSISRLIAEREKDRTNFETERSKIQEELHVANQHLSNTEAAFSDVHSKYERLKNVVSAYKSNETVLKESITENQETIKTLQSRYEQLKSHAMAQLEKANLELKTIRKHNEAETIKLKALVRKAELKSKSLEETVEQKMKENKELTQIIDEMIARVD